MPEHTDPAKIIHEEFPSVSPRPRERVGHIRPVMTTGLEMAIHRALDGSVARPVIGKLAVDPQVEGTNLNPYNGELRYQYDVREVIEREIKPSLEDFLCNHMQNVIPDAQPLEIDKEAIKERLAKTTLVVRNYDDYRSVFKQGYGVDIGITGGGLYDATKRIINFSKAPQELTDNRVWSTELFLAAHEYVHAASSQNFYIIGRQAPENISVGLQKHGRNSAYFKWFNEAVTDTVAEWYWYWSTGYSQPDDAQTLSIEKQIMENMTEVGGISTKAILEAYFEEPDLNASSGQRQPKWHALQAEFTRAYGPRFLKKVDDLIKELQQEGKDPGTLLGRDGFGRNYFEREKREWDKKVSELGFEKAKEEALKERIDKKQSAPMEVGA